ncbi:LytR/AlgR family response regulator transcription factor [Flavivirga spongiicola]|uniref:LytTR family transcriptional regulator n=1 Tax=Flavivirga spongiicola TaxID=421621 RepID=A0ABU7XXR7_9FLAO|nr:LytTR family DNA-binding domain-containing protein [Flavivirga sp. MEBiC05379]MDO5980253.1 LytTR family DNA-binding domain-containing protein [Flavivirga sp. MEBiC05379]
MKFSFFGINKNFNRAIKHLGYWLAFVSFFTLVWGTYDNDYLRNFMIQILSLPARLALVYVALYFLFPKFFLKKKYVTFVFLYILLLIFVTVFIQRVLFFYVVQPNYLQNFETSNFFAITEIMNTLLDVNIAAIIPLGYVFFKNWQITNQKTIELESQKLNSVKDEKFIYLKVEKSLQKIFLKDIIFIESLKNYVKVKTTHREIIAYKSISSIEDMLTNKKFLRVHRSFIVGLDFIDSFSPSKLILKGTPIPIGRKYKEEVKAVLGYF